jgi:hypothetical protein
VCGFPSSEMVADFSAVVISKQEKQEAFSLFTVLRTLYLCRECILSDCIKYFVLRNPLERGDPAKPWLLLIYTGGFRNIFRFHIQISAQKMTGSGTQIIKWKFKCFCHLRHRVDNLLHTYVGCRVGTV